MESDLRMSIWKITKLIRLDFGQNVLEQRRGKVWRYRNLN